MTEQFSFINLVELKEQGNKLFNKLRIPFIRSAIPLEKKQQGVAIVNDVHPIQELHIEQTDLQAIYKVINNSSKFHEVVTTIMRDDTTKLRLQIQHLLNEYSESMPSDVAENIQLLSKYVVNFQRRLQMTLRTSFEDCNDITSMQEKARDVLSKAFSEGLISHIMPALLEGLKTSPSYYKWVVEYFKDFLMQYGIYTRVFNVNQDIDYDLLDPKAIKETDNESLHGKIADLLLLPYFFYDDTYQGHALLCEGQCVAWKSVK